MRSIIRKATLYGLVIYSISACTKRETIDYYQPTGPVSVTIDRTSVSAGTPLQLQFSGYADSLIFFSGREGNQYVDGDDETIQVEPFLSFTSYRQWGTQENTLRLMVSRDFDGENYSEAGINAATWVDITDRVTLSSGADNTPSGDAELLDFVGGDRPLFLAFKFTGQAGTTQRTWTIRNFQLKVRLPNGDVEDVADIGSAGWLAVSIKNPDMRWTQSATQIQMVGGNETAAENEDWIITKPFYFDGKVANIGKVIKTRYQLMLKDYFFVYDEPGTYEAAVVAKTGAGSAQTESVSKFSIEVH